MVRIIHAEALDALRTFGDDSFDLIYVDPPFNTGSQRSLRSIKATATGETGANGFGVKHYEKTVVSEASYSDTFDDYLGFLKPHFVEARRVLRSNGSLFVHIDYREAHYVKVLLDTVFGRRGFLNEIIWAYDFGGRSKVRWAPKHDTIFWYVMDPARYHFNYDAVDRIPYMAPGLVGEEKAARGKTPTDVWWNTIVGTNAKERTGYPTQKPLQILRRIVRVHSPAGGDVLDFFAGSGTTGEACAVDGRNATLVDSNPAAIQAMQRRLNCYQPLCERK